MAAEAGDRDFQVAVILDSENVIFNTLMSEFVNNVETSLRHVDDRYRISQTRVYSGHRDTYHLTQHLRLEQQNFRYLPTRKRERICACGHVQDRGEGPGHEFERTYDVADSILIDEMLGCGLLDNLPPNILLISTDRDFIPSLSYLSAKKYKIFVAKNKNSDESLYSHRYASATWDWKDLQKGLPPKYQRQIRNRRNTSRAQAMSPSNDVAIFWDFNSLQPTDFPVQDMLKSIQQRIKSVDPKLEIQGYEKYACGDVRLFTDVQRRALEENRFRIFHAPERSYRCKNCKQGHESDVKPHAPEILIRSMMLGRALTGDLPRTILLITGDCDFSNALRYLKTKGFNVYLVKSEKSESFGNVVSYPPWNWEDL